MLLIQPWQVKPPESLDQAYSGSSSAKNRKKKKIKLIPVAPVMTGTKYLYGARTILDPRLLLVPLCRPGALSNKLPEQRLFRYDASAYVCMHEAY